jgi:hypothetical protein
MYSLIFVASRATGHGASSVGGASAKNDLFPGNTSLRLHSRTDLN